MLCVCIASEAKQGTNLIKLAFKVSTSIGNSFIQNAEFSENFFTPEFSLFFFNFLTIKQRYGRKTRVQRNRLKSQNQCNSSSKSENKVHKGCLVHCEESFKMHSQVWMLFKQTSSPSNTKLRIRGVKKMKNKGKNLQLQRKACLKIRQGRFLYKIQR